MVQAARVAVVVLAVQVEQVVVVHLGYGGSLPIPEQQLPMPIHLPVQAVPVAMVLPDKEVHQERL